MQRHCASAYAESFIGFHDEVCHLLSRTEHKPAKRAPFNGIG